MKTTKLVTSLLCFVLFVLMLFQSCTANVASSLSNSEDVSGSMGFMVAVLMLAGAIVQLVTRTSIKKGGSIASMILFALAALFGMTSVGAYQDLVIWGFWCLVLAIINLICIVKKNKLTEVENK